MAALDAAVVVLGANGERSIPLVDSHRLPDDAPHRDTVLEHGELIIAVDLPELPIATRSAYHRDQLLGVDDRRRSAPFATSTAPTPPRS